MENAGAKGSRRVRLSIAIGKNDDAVSVGEEDDG